MSDSKFSALTHSVFVKLIAVTIFSIGAISAILLYRTDNSLTDLTNSAREVRTALVNDLVASQSGGSLRYRKGEVLERLFTATIDASNNQALGAVAVTVDGNLLSSVGNDAAVLSPLAEQARKAMATGTEVTSADGLSVARPIFYGKTNELVGAIGVAWTDSLSQQVIADNHRSAMIFAIVAFVLATLATIFLINHVVTRPLNGLRNAMGRIAERDYETAVPGVTKGDEIGRLSRDLDGLREILAAGEVAKIDNAAKGAAFMGSSAAMMLVDKEERISVVNPAASELMRKHTERFRKYLPDFDPEKVVGMPVASFHRGKDHAKDAFRGSEKGSFRAAMQLGDARLAIGVSRVTSENGEVVGYVLEWADVTQDAKNAALIEAIDSSQCRAEFDVNGTFTSANQQFCDLLGRSIGEVLGRRFEDLLSKDLGYVEEGRSLARAIQGGQSHYGKMRFGRGASDAVMEGGINCMRDDRGRISGFLLLGKDVTEDEAKLAAAEAKREEIERQQAVVVDKLRVALRQLSAGDLTGRIEEPFAGSYEDLRNDYNLALDNLTNALREIMDGAEKIRNEARDISTTADGLSRRTEGTAATLEQTAAALGELTNSVRSAADGASEADRVVADARVRAETSGKVVLETVSAMDEIAASSDKITSIIKVIDDIAFQTNLLALNAGVEAARAGDAGRGFAVVASEVRALAQRSSEAAREISDLIASSGTQVKRGVDLVGRTGTALQEIVGSVSQISTLVSEIAASSKQQSAGLAEINGAVNELDQSTQQNAARLEETTAASEALTSDAVSLVNTVGHFRVTGGSASSVMAAPAAAAEPVVATFKPKAPKPAAPSRPMAPPMPAPRKQMAASGGAVSVVGNTRRLELSDQDAAGWKDF